MDIILHIFGVCGDTHSHIDLIDIAILSSFNGAL